MGKPMRHTAIRMSDANTGAIDVGPPLKTAENWQLTPRPAENLDAADLSIVTGPSPAQDDVEPSASDRPQRI